MDQPGKVANPTRGQLNTENEYVVLHCLRSRLRICSRETGSAVPAVLLYRLRYFLHHTYPLPCTNTGYGKRKAHKNWPMVIPQKGSTRHWDYLEDYWPCAGGVSAVNAIGT